MNARAADAFFKKLGAQLKGRCRFVLIGGIAAGHFGRPRNTGDIDFAALPSDESAWEADEQAMLALAKEEGVILQYSTDIGRWSMISLLDWAKHTLPHKKFGKLEIRLLHPLYWSIGKISRGVDRDLGDLEIVFKKQGVAWKDLATLWARALRDSPPSDRQFNTKKQAERFFVESGKKIWGKNFVSDDAVKLFHKNLGLKN